MGATRSIFARSIERCGRHVWGPVSRVVAARELAGYPGVYLVAGISPTTDRNEWVYGGQSKDVGGRLRDWHERAACWELHSVGEPTLFFHHVPGGGFDDERRRLEVEAEFRRCLNPVCNRM